MSPVDRGVRIREVPRRGGTLPSMHSDPLRSRSTGSVRVNSSTQSAGATEGADGVFDDSPATELQPLTASEDSAASLACPAEAPMPKNPLHESSRELIMRNAESTSILRSLIQGHVPGSGETLPPECVIHRPDVLRALLAGVSALDQTAARAHRRSHLPDNVGSTWTTEEESRLVTLFKSGVSPASIARQHARTLRAIEARLEKLGLITAEQRTTRGGFMG